MSPGDERRFPKAVWGWVLAWVVLAIVAAIWGIPNEENDLTTRSEGVLSDSGLSVGFAGRDATITGNADQAAIDTAAEAVYNLRGVRRVDVSGATAVAPTTTTTTTAAPATTTTAAAETTTTAAPPEDPSFQAAEADGTVTLSGTLPTQTIIDDIEAAAIATYGDGNVVNNMQVGNVTDSTDLASIPGIFATADGLNPWQFALEHGQITYSGIGPDEDAVAAKRTTFADFLASFAAAQGSIEVDPNAVAASLTDLLAGGANFETGSANLSAEAKDKLDEVIGVMLDNPSTLLTVEGYTDNQGDAADNQALSEARAQAVVDYLVAGGVTADRLTAVGYGEENPIASNDTAEGRAKNRRIEFVVREGE